MTVGIKVEDLFQQLSLRERRKIIGANSNEFKEMIAKIYKARSSNLGTHEIATLLSQALSHITKNSLLKKLTTRVLNNADMFAKSHEQAEAMGKTL